MDKYYVVVFLHVHFYEQFIPLESSNGNELCDVKVFLVGFSSIDRYRLQGTCILKVKGNQFSVVSPF